MSRTKFLLLTISFVFAFCPLLVKGVAVGPVKLQYKVDPGATISGKLFVVNDGAETQIFYAAFEKFIEQGGEKKFIPSEESELSNWFKMENSVSIEPGQQKEIPFTIEVPQAAPPGGHFAVIWWGAASPGGQVAIVTRAGILVYVEVSGEINEKGELLNFSSLNKKFFFSRLPEDFAVHFENDGNTYLKPAGEIKIKNILGSTIATFSVNDKERIILPQDNQTLNVSKEFKKPPFAFGLYKAELNLQWGETPNNAAKSIYLFIFPWKIALLAAIIMAIIILLATKGVKKYNQWIVKKYGGAPKGEFSEQKAEPSSWEPEPVVKNQIKQKLTRKTAIKKGRNSRRKNKTL
jgi:hypothetical protein